MLGTVSEYPEKAKIYGSNLSQKKHANFSDLRNMIIYDSPGSVTDKRFCLALNYFSHSSLGYY